MLDIKFVRENPDAVRENIRKKFQDGKLPLVDKVLELDKRNREIKTEVETLRAKRKTVSKEIGKLMGQGKKDEAEQIKAEMAGDAARIDELSAEEVRVEEELLKTMMVQASCRREAKDSALLSSRDGHLLEPTWWPKGP